MGSEKLRVHCAITFLKIFFWFLRVKEKQQQLKKEGKGIVFGYSFFFLLVLHLNRFPHEIHLLLTLIDFGFRSFNEVAHFTLRSTEFRRTDRKSRKKKTR